MNWNKCKIYWKKGWIPCLVITGVAIYLLNVTWLKWGNLIIDSGRVFYVPSKLLSGSLLYKDIAYEHGPFSPYFNAFLCKVFGIHIYSFVISGLVTMLVFCIFLYKICRIFINATFSTLSLITFLFVFAFGHYYYSGIFNFILPYSFATIHSVTLAVAALFFYYCFLAKEKKIYSCLCIFFTTLVLATRLIVGGALIGSLFIAVMLDFKKYGSFMNRIKKVSLYCIYPLFVAGVIYCVFIIISKLTTFQDNVGIKELFLRNIELIRINLDIGRRFTGNLMGTNDFYGNILMILKVILYYLGISALFLTGGRIVFLVSEAGLMKKRLVTIGIVLVIASIIVIFHNRFIPYNLQYRCVPIICIALSVIAYRRYLKGVEERKFLFLAVFSAFSLMLLFRMFFNVWAGHYGFYLLVPGMLCYYIFFLKIVPNKFKKIQTQKFYKLGFIMVAILFIMSHKVTSFFMYKNRTLKISSSRGSMRVFPGYYRYKQLLDYLREQTDPKASLIVFSRRIDFEFFLWKGTPFILLLFFAWGIF